MLFHGVHGASIAVSVRDRGVHCSSALAAQRIASAFARSNAAADGARVFPASCSQRRRQCSSSRA
jgi:hypothetical protein